MPQTFIEAATTGFGTYKYTGTPDGTTTLAQLCGLTDAAVPAGVSGFDLAVVTTAGFYENDGTNATTNDQPLLDGIRVRNAETPIRTGKFKFIAGGAVDWRITLWG